MSERAAFVEATAARPTDDNARLAFADWLEERGDRDEDAGHAALLRAESSLHAMAAGRTYDYRALIQVQVLCADLLREYLPATLRCPAHRVAEQCPSCVYRGFLADPDVGVELTYRTVPAFGLAARVVSCPMHLVYRPVCRECGREPGTLPASETCQCRRFRQATQAWAALTVASTPVCGFDVLPPGANPGPRVPSEVGKALEVLAPVHRGRWPDSLLDDDRTLLAAAYGVAVRRRIFPDAPPVFTERELEWKSGT